MKVVFHSFDVLKPFVLPFAKGLYVCLFWRLGYGFCFLLIWFCNDNAAKIKVHPFYCSIITEINVSYNITNPLNKVSNNTNDNPISYACISPSMTIWFCVPFTRYVIGSVLYDKLKCVSCFRQKMHHPLSGFTLEEMSRRKLEYNRSFYRLYFT